MHFTKTLLLFGFSFLLVACVTTYENPERVINKENAIDANVKLGMTYLQQGSREAASRAFLSALKIDKNSAEAHQGMALVHQLNGETKMAEQRFQRALKGKAYFSMAGVHLSYGRFLLDQSRPQEAKTHFEIASQDITYRSRAEALYYLGLTSAQLGHEIQAKASYEYALNLDKRFAPAALELSELNFNSGSYTAAKKYLDRYNAIAKQSSRSLWLGIRIERIFGNQDKEASYAMALRNLHPYSKEYLEYKKLNKQTSSQ